MNSERQFRNYCLQVFLIFGFFLSLGLANYLFLRRAHEIASYDSIAADHVALGGLYGSALHGNDLKYKLAMFKKKRPQIVVVGSSRAMGIREVAFNQSFLNCGGVFSNLLEGETFVSEMLKIHAPKVVLLFVDYWWFHPNYAQSSNRYHNTDETLVTMERITYPTVWLWNGKISWSMFRDVLWKGYSQNEFTNYKSLGVFALKYSAGFRPDGTYLNSKSVFAIDGVYQSHFKEELEQTRQRKFERINLGYGDFVEESRFMRFRKMVGEIRKAGSEVLIVLPPVIPVFYEAATRKGRPEFVTALSRRFAEMGTEFYDLTQMSESEAPSCEYIDAFHLGEVNSLRIVAQILQKNPNSVLAHYTDRTKIAELSLRWAGRVLIAMEDVYKVREADFLELGCDKSGGDSKSKNYVVAGGKPPATM